MSISQNASLDQLRISGAMKGYLADQKSVLLFHDRQDAPSVLYKFEVPSTDLPKVHENMLADGLAFHTIVPHAGGMSIYVADLDGSLHDAVAKASGRYNANVEYRWGDAQFIGTQQETGSDRDQRDDARRAYAKIIAESALQGSQGVWQRIHNRWGEALTPRAWLARAKRPKTEIELWPDEDQSEEDFLDYCIDELTPCLGADRADEVCNAKWEASGKLGKKGFIARADLPADLRIEPCGKSCLACNEAPASKAGYDPSEPRDPAGKWTEDGGGDDDLGSMALGGEDRNITATTRKVDALRDEMGASDIPLDQRQALDMYTLDSSHFNQLARLGSGPATTEMKTLDALVDGHKLPREMTVYRTVGWQRTKEILDHVGDSFSDPAFMSTTLDKSKIDKPGSYIEIKIPKGSKAFPIGSLSNFPEEAEILFPRNSRLEIVSHEARAAPNTERFVARLVS